MKKIMVIVASSLILLLVVPQSSNAQLSGMAGIKMGLGIAAGNAGFQIGPGGELIFNKKFAISTEFNIGTSTGTPVEWVVYGKYFINIPRSIIRPYVDLGLSLLFFTGGPYFGIRFGGGSLFMVAKDFYLMGDIQAGPTFATGGGIFAFSICAGVRYEFR